MDRYGLIDTNDGWINEWIDKENGWMKGRIKIELTLTLKTIIAGPLQTWFLRIQMWKWQGWLP